MDRTQSASVRTDIRDFKMSKGQRQRRLQGDPRFVLRMREVKSHIVAWLLRRKILDFDVVPKREDCACVMKKCVLQKS